MNLNVGDIVIYPAHGVGRIEALENKVVGEHSYNFFVLRILENGMKISIPAQNLNDIGLRTLMTQEEMVDINLLLQTPTIQPEIANWNRRQRNYMEQIKTGDPREVAMVFRELMSMRGEKELSFGERKLLDMVKTLLLKEMSLVAQRPEAEMEAEIEGFFPPPYKAPGGRG